ncbi:MAG: ABC transporter substrate-binding protein [Limnochordia bacterium]|nr:ABC transporter substrate-binding protein [Limnochordia bacterium]
MLRKQKNLMFCIFVLCAALIAGLVAWFLRPTQQYIGGEPQESLKPVLRLPGGDWGPPAPYLHYSRGPGVYKMQLVFDSLLERDGSGYIPWLATGYQVLDQGRTYVFKLRQGVKWHDGRKLTPEDVLFSFEYALRHPPVQAHITSENITMSVEEDSFIVHLDFPDAAMLGKLGSVRIIPKHIYENIEDPIGFLEPSAFIGTGPFKLEQYNREHGTYRFVENSDFFGPAPKVSAIEFVPVSDETLALLQGDLDAATIPPDAISLFADLEQFAVMQNPGFWGYRLLFNMNVEPLGSIKFRQALAHGIDRQQLVEKIARGAGVLGSYGILPVDHINYNPQVIDYPYDPELAKQLIAEEEIAIPSLSILVAGEREARIGQLLKEQLAEMGIELNIRSVDAKTKDTLIQTGQYQLGLIGHGGMGMDPDYLRIRFAQEKAGQMISQVSSVGFANDEINRLCLKQRKTTDESLRQDYLNQLQNLIAENIPEIPLFCTTDYFVYNREKLDGWVYMFDHHEPTHCKMSYLVHP